MALLLINYTLHSKFNRSTLTFKGWGADLNSFHLMRNRAVLLWVMIGGRGGVVAIVVGSSRGGVGRSLVYKGGEFHF